MPTPTCPECKGSDVVKNGLKVTRRGPRQRWLCKRCGRNFYLEVAA